eukprot:CAMPEP_0117064064 /NCGR_PEP_ID=MMETSP0472-20121206/44728_1 /TAXON_ID=693140 ORGANISM="Tiarina fusus, Strain LIS" /NCGR_SAMPLE_ID=MMETSP0472 /ASSEMBLY_ACC=CAM_ASM_000603 /LENGTH=132 /DNA_ID=CAMNT_0004784027 /DNA_START=9 /DNA_END=404 /DNA_ORIENTATION=+
MLQNKLDEDRKEIEQRMKGNVEAFTQEEGEMKKAFTEANESNLWALQQRHWLESGNMQKANHEEQQKFIANIQSELESRKTPRTKPTEDKTSEEDAEAIKREQEEQERLQREQQELQEQLERQLEEQQEAEK